MAPCLTPDEELSALHKLLEDFVWSPNPYKLVLDAYARGEPRIYKSYTRIGKGLFTFFRLKNSNLPNGQSILENIADKAETFFYGCDECDCKALLTVNRELFHKNIFYLKQHIDRPQTALYESAVESFIAVLSRDEIQAVNIQTFNLPETVDLEGIYMSCYGLELNPQYVKRLVDCLGLFCDVVVYPTMVGLFYHDFRQRWGEQPC